MSANDEAKIYTFYSYKGGVGRSMAMANVAELLYRSGLRVLMVDFDLEAPGLEQYFYTKNEPELQKLLCKRGVIDLLFSYKSLRSLSDANPSSNTISESSPETNPSTEDEDPPASDEFPYPVEPLSSFITKIRHASPDMPGELSIITAGRRAKEELKPERKKKQTKDEFALYADRVRSFAWDNFYLNLDGERFFDWFRREVIKDVDIVLIDSRTGVAEMSGVCTYQLADVVVMFAAPNNQNIDGIKRIADSLTNPDLISAGRKGRRLSLIFVPSRVDEKAEKEKLDDLAARFREAADKLISPDLRFETNSFVDLQIPYISYYSFVEELAVRETESPAAIQISKAYKKICRSFAQLDPKIEAKLKPETESADSVNLAEQQNRAANQVYDQLTPDEQKAARSLFKRLVRPAQVEAGELKDSPKTVKFDDVHGPQRGVAGKFAAQGLLVISPDGSEPKTIGLAAEGLIDNWTRFHEWLDEDREFLLWRQDLQSALLNWEKNRRHEFDLLAESKAAELEKWMPSHSDDLSLAELKYIQVSLSSRGQKQRQRRLQLAGVFLGLVIVSFVVFYLYKQNLRLNQLDARSRQLASKSADLLYSLPDLSLLLAIEASRVADTDDAQKALKAALLQPRVQTAMRISEPAFSARFSRDGKRLVTTSGTGGSSIAQIWQRGGDTGWQNPITLRGHKDIVFAAAFSPDGQFVATSSYDGTTMLWNSLTGEMIGIPTQPTNKSLADIDWSPDGNFVAAANLAENLVYVWDVKTRQLFKTLRGFTNNVYSVSFSPDGRFLAAGSADRQVRIWDINTWNEVISPLREHTDAVVSVRFSNDSNYLLTASTEGTAVIWDTSKWSTVAILKALSSIKRASFSPDGQRIVVVNEDKASIWETNTGIRVAVMVIPFTSVNDASFSPDGKLVLTVNRDGSVRLWEWNPQVDPDRSTSVLVSLACARATRNMTDAEWGQYMGNESYRLTCPNTLPIIPPPTPSILPSLPPSSSVLQKKM